MVRKTDEQGLSGWQERTAEDMVSKSAFPMPIPAGMNASDGMNGSIPRGTPSQVGMLSQIEKRILRRIRDT